MALNDRRLVFNRQSRSDIIASTWCSRVTSESAPDNLRRNCYYLLINFLKFEFGFEIEIESPRQRIVLKIFIAATETPTN